MIGDVEKMVVIGLVWGATNALMGRGALLWDQTSNLPPIHPTLQPTSSLPSDDGSSSSQFSTTQAPFALSHRLSYLLCHSKRFPNIARRSGHQNATTFAATAVFGMLLGEDNRVGYALFGTAIIGFGVWLCIN